MNQVWTKAELEYVRQNCDKLKDRELAEKLSQLTGRKVTIAAVRKQRQRLGIAKEKGKGVCRVVGQKKSEHTGVAVKRNLGENPIELSDGSMGNSFGASVDLIKYGF